MLYTKLEQHAYPLQEFWREYQIEQTNKYVQGGEVMKSYLQKDGCFYQTSQ